MDIKSLTAKQLKEQLELMGEKPFRSKQIYEWIHIKMIRDFDEMTNISQNLRNALKEKFTLTTLQIEKVQESKIDHTRKYLHRLPDGHMVESVFMKYLHGNSVCISTQVGCRMGCKFCASTIDGLERNLEVGELLDQIYSIILDTKERVSNIVLMGAGEPLDNYDAVVQFIDMISNEEGYHISQRNITVSTCGIVPMIKKLAEESLQITLALSLHATTDEKRKVLMPIANKYSLDEVIKACKFYFEQTKRRLTFEYSLVENVNDSMEDATELIELLKGINCHVNLIPVNPIKERDFRQSNMSRIEAFKNKLEKNKINVTIRREMGRDIDGACGQLRRSYIEETNK